MKTPTRPFTLWTVVFALTVTAACTRVLEIEEKISPDLKSAKYPALVPLTDKFASQSLPGDESVKLEASLNAQGAAAQRRAEALRQAREESASN